MYYHLCNNKITKHLKFIYFTRDWGFVQHWLINATALLVSYVGIADVVKHFVNTETQLGFGNNSASIFIICNSLHYD